MNKYNKHKVELGRYLPSWVKYGTLALGIGTCIEIGDQSTAYAGNYRVVIESENTIIKADPFESTDRLCSKFALFLLLGITLVCITARSRENS